MRTYGTIKLRGDRWVVEVEPHVRARMKRIFKALAKTRGGVMTLPDTQEIAFELDWVRQRYPMEIDADSAEAFQGRVRSFVERRSTIESILYDTAYTPPLFDGMALPAREYQRQAADLLLQSGHLLLADDLGIGKQQPIDTPVLTPGGYRRIGSLKVGDQVIGSTGRPVTVTGVFPQGIKPSYRVSFGDGSSTEAGPDHLWALDYYRGGRTLARITLTTDQMRTRPAAGGLQLKGVSLYAPMLSGPVEFAPGADLPLPAYLLGQLIANGALTSSSATVTVGTEDWPDVERSLRDDGVEIGAVQVYGGATRVGILGAMPSVRALELDVPSELKRIPRAYLQASPRDRVALLHGLMDGDGSASHTGSKLVYTTTSAGLAQDVVELVECLGGVASARRYERDGKATEHHVRVRPPEGIQPFRIPRKAERYHPTKRRRPTRLLKSVEYVRLVESVCISVDAPDRLYATSHALLTHNTVSAIAALSEKRTLPALVVTLTHLPKQWDAEIRRFAPHLHTHILKKGTPYEFRQARLGGGAFPDVLISNYHKLAGWTEALAGKVKTVVFDECLRGDTQVSLWPPGRGTLSIERIAPGETIAAFAEDGSLHPDRVRAVVLKGMREVWRMTLADGRAVVCTNNERFWTSRGWLYLQEIIDAASPEDTRESPQAVDRHGAADGAGHLARGRQPELAKGRATPAPSDAPRPRPGGLLPPQGGGAAGLRTNAAQDGAKPRMGPRELRLRDGDLAGLRVLGLPLLHGQGWPAGEDGDEGMGGRAGLAGDRLLVHGRWDDAAARSSAVLDPLVHGDRGATTGSAAGFAGGPSDRREDQEGRAILLDHPNPQRADETVRREGPPVHSSVDELQAGTAAGGTAQDLHRVRDRDSRRSSARRDVRLVPQAGVRGCEEQGGQLPSVPEPALDGVGIASIEFVGLDYVWDLETVEHHTFLANGIAVHNCQELRHPGSGKHDAATEIAHAAEYRLGLSATPVYNYGGEMHSVLGVLAPGALGTKSEFVEEWCAGAGGDKPVVKDPKALGTYLREQGLMLRRTRADVGRELPALTRATHHIEANLGGIAKLSETVAELARTILTQHGITSQERMKASSELDWRLRHATGMAKAPYVAEFVRMLVEAGEQVLLYGWHHECFAKGTQVLMFDGTTMPVEDVAVGARVMGPDSRPRTVKSLTRGHGAMYRVTPTKGDPWVCSENHILALRCSEKNRRPYVTMPVSEYMQLSPRARRAYALYRAPETDFGGSRVVEPWLLGYWLGDGVSSLERGLRISTADPEVAEEAECIAGRYGLSITVHPCKRGDTPCSFYHLSSGAAEGGWRRNRLLNLFRELGLHENKHVPLAYKTAPAAARRELLAGLLDSDGHVYHGNGAGSAVIMSKIRRLADDIAFLCRSLGLAAYVSPTTRTTNLTSEPREYFRVNISGDLTGIPTRIARKRAPARLQRKNVLHTGFEVAPIGKDDFYGFEVDEDHLFLLGDFTVVHNCYAIWREKLADLEPAFFTGQESVPQKEEAKRRFLAGESKVLIMSLRAGAGIDGLQGRARTVVFGELDWSPGVHEQAIGRIHRDGQKEPVVAYFLVADDGSDPVIADILGLKREQIEGLRDPNGELFEPRADAGNHVVKLAQDFLARHGGKAKGAAA